MITATYRAAVLSLREGTFEAVLTDVADSLKTHGFEHIVFIGDSGGNQGGQRTGAERLNAKRNAERVVAHVGEYLRLRQRRRAHGRPWARVEPRAGLHDDPVITLSMFHGSPHSVRYDERVAAGHATIDGVSIADRITSLELAREIVSFLATHTADAIKTAIANRGTLTATPRTTSVPPTSQAPDRPVTNDKLNCRPCCLI